MLYLANLLATDETDYYLLSWFDIILENRFYKYSQDGYKNNL